MSRVEPKNILENLLQMQNSDNKTNELDFDSSLFQKIFKKDANDADPKGKQANEGQLNGILENPDMLELQQQEINNLANNLLIQENEFHSVEKVISPQLLVENNQINNPQQLINTSLTEEEMNILEDKYIGSVDKVLLQGEFLLENDKIIHLNNEKINVEQVSSLHQLLNNVFSKMFSYDEQSQKNVFVSSKEDDKQSVLQIWVPLTSIATGKLAQSSDLHIATSVYQQMNMNSGESKNNVTQATSSNQVQAAITQSGQNFSTNSIKSNALQATTPASNSFSQEAKRTSSLHYATATAQISQEVLGKKFTFFHNEEGMTIWYRDYESSEQFIEEKLSQIKAMLEKHSQIKMIGYNGKVLYSNTEDPVADLGEKHAG